MIPTTPVDITAALPSLESILERATGYSPQLKASAATLEVSRSNFKVARSGFAPTLSLQGIVGSNFSSNILEQNTETQKFEQIVYFDQLKLNQQKIVQLSISISLFNGLSRHFETQMARVDMRNAELDFVTAQNNLRQTLEQAYLDVLAAQENSIPLWPTRSTRTRLLSRRSGVMRQETQIPFRYHYLPEAAP